MKHITLACITWSQGPEYAVPHHMKIAPLEMHLELSFPYHHHHVASLNLYYMEPQEIRWHLGAPWPCR